MRCVAKYDFFNIHSATHMCYIGCLRFDVQTDVLIHVQIGVQSEALINVYIDAQIDSRFDSQINVDFDIPIRACSERI